MKPSVLASALVFVLSVSGQRAFGQQAAGSVAAEKLTARCDSLLLASRDLTDMGRAQSEPVEKQIAYALAADATQAYMACEASRQLLVIKSLVSTALDRQRVAAATKAALDWWSRGENITITQVRQLGSTTRVPGLAQAAQALVPKIRAFQTALPTDP
jgi:hypothetical protein